MLKQGQTWYPLSNIRDMMEIEHKCAPINRYACRTLSNHEIIMIKSYLYYYYY